MIDLDIEKLTDEELVKLTLKNQENFLYLMKRYSRRLTAYIRRLSNFDSDEAEDILQDTFIKIYNNLNDFDSSLKFSSWIYRICHNQIIDHYRKSKSRPQTFDLDFNDEIINNLAFDFDMAKELDISYLRKNINSVLDSMELKYKEVLLLRYFEDKDYQEISDILKKPMGTVATLINRAKKQLKEKLSTAKIEL
ncbi:MAG: RNA polymerase sigma factor [bacterium]|nr:RNA polymerase sigma factor [bacterium]